MSCATEPQGADGSRAAESADDRFFAALLTDDFDELEALLDSGFWIIDAIAGSVTRREEFIAGLRSGFVSFRQIDVLDRKSRDWGSVIVVRGRTRMLGTAAGQAFELASRYTHVFARAAGVWRLVNAQGTQIDIQEYTDPSTSR
jgi:hypothetical protein